MKLKFKLKYFLLFLLIQQVVFGEGDAPKKKNSFLKLSSKDVEMILSGALQEDYFFYHRVRTLSDDFYDQNDFFRHKLYLDFNIKQGEKKYGKPATEAGVRLTNYVLWQQNNYYMPFSREDLRSQALDSVVVAENVTSKTIMPLIFLEEAWAKINFDTFTRTWNKNPTFLKAGFFQYEVGRGISLGYHDDLAVEYMGWPGTGKFTRYPQMPPGVLLRCSILDSLSFDAYFMKWLEVDANLDDVMYPSRAQRLNTSRTERGSNKDRYNFALRLDYTPEEKDFGKTWFQPYWVYTHAPELSIEFDSDAKAYLHTLGIMIDYEHNGFEVNCEVAGQFGDQTMFEIDRNIQELSRSANDGTIKEVFSHIFFDDNTSRVTVPVQSKSSTSQKEYSPDKYLTYMVNTPSNRNLQMQGQKITDISTSQGSKAIYNSDLFGNARFRPSYTLEHRGFMALFDIGYTFEKLPIRVGGALGHISGDNYPYNEEVSKTYHGFIPMRSRYKGMQVKNTLIFDRLVVPRPLNISNRTMYAFNNLKDLSNLQFLGLGLTWHPLNKKETCFINSDLMFFWESATLYKWDKNGHYPDPAIEKQIAYDRAYLGFPGVARQYTSSTTNSGWISDETASRFLGAELDLHAEWNPIKNCALKGQVCLFFPGQLYKDLDGQPNILTQYIDNQRQIHYESLGDKFAFALIAGLDYKF